MIGRLSGTLIESQPPHLLLDVAGVGYEIEAPLSTFYSLASVGSAIVLHTHLHVREDAQVLYGFATLAERSLFRTLIKVSGVGAKMALAILSGMSVEAFHQCVLANDATTLTKLPGIGRKTAERLLIEMRDKVDASIAGSSVGLPGDVTPSAQNPVNDAVAALISLGYKPQEASRLISRVEGEADSSQELIRLALKATLKT